MLGEENDIFERWVEYFQEVLKHTETTARGKGKRTGELNEEPPIYTEIEESIKKMKNNKAPGEDNIRAELIKYGRKPLAEAIHKIIVKIWETEKMPDK